MRDADKLHEGVCVADFVAKCCRGKRVANHWSATLRQLNL
jgi:hypothetical protein